MNPQALLLLAVVACGGKSATISAREGCVKVPVKGLRRFLHRVENTP